MGDAVVEVVKSCLPCARVKARFRESEKEPQPLSLRGLVYNRGVDFAEPLETIMGVGMYRSFYKLVGADLASC